MREIQSGGAGMENTKEKVTENDNLVVSLIESQKNDKKFYKIIILILLGIILFQGLYHEYQWSQFDTIVVDGGEGGDANYIGNDGDINNYGESDGAQEKTGKQ